MKVKVIESLEAVRRMKQLNRETLQRILECPQNLTIRANAE
jgi:hypothetical protein